MIDNNLQFQDFHLRNWNSQKAVHYFEPDIPQTIFSGSSCAPEIGFSLPVVLLDCNLIQDHAVWISSLCTHYLEHNNSKNLFQKDRFRFLLGSNFKVLYVLI